MRGLILTCLTAALLASLMVAAPAAFSQQSLRGGTSAADAAASCWEVKQKTPAAANGNYWLQTPKLVAPEQFYCDMTTDGGGWVLIGRGRQDWRPEYQGQGTPAQVRDAVTGPAAFGVRTLPSPTVDALLDGGRVDALADPVRLRRATNTGGTAWQESRFRFANRDRWAWSFGAEHRVGAFTFDGAAGSGGQTVSFGLDDALRRVDTRDDQAGQGWVRGWSYGSQVKGTNSADSHLYSATNGAGFARPFTQMFLRPKLLSSDISYPAVPDGGTAKQPLSPLLQSGAEPQEWGVTGRATANTGELYTESQDATQVGNTVFVGGNFKFVQKGQNPAPGDQIQQSYLAGFDVNTGQWVPSFRPVFNGQVKTLAPLPNGKLIAGGEFTTVNGQPAVGVVALDPVTGAIDPDWKLTVESRLTCCTVKIRTLDIEGDWLYIGGSFTHLKGGKQAQPAFARNAGRVSLADATADASWNPNFNGSVFDLDLGSAGERFYAAGHMTWSNNQTTDNVAILGTGAGAPLVPGMKPPKFSNATHYQQAIVEAGDRVWVGGSQHSMFSYAKDDFTSLSGNITKAGGDIQSAEVYDGVVYATCHCRHWAYSESYTWPEVGTKWTQADKIDLVGAWDVATGKMLPEFTPWFNANYDQGPWGSFKDSTGKVWFMGDMRQARRTNGSFQWVGGFARFAPRDTVAPSTPGALGSTDAGNNTRRLSWGGSTDDRGGLRYEVLQGDRVVSTGTATSLVVPAPTQAQRYFVRAVDTAGNRSASTPVHSMNPAAAAR
ncbi:hypothetical protein CFN78_25775 [Amycolatopsis antarctica]|uniref:Fibrinogen C-terminal domain-containing protein n=1 Tax=Amycolatopsis antarctica TaxID=1854586 RepID=A0A263CW19_9PSEU|nr:delta-60 repeat domain-containing protein [Amycolatopsis antarctica]OZM70334.1 hypothetical protein CFN78_25775 [Amycolatopsis antarctica]